MKKVVRYVLPLFACAVLAFSLSSCGKIAGSKYKCDKLPGVTMSFDDAKNWHIDGWKQPGVPETAKIEVKGTYKTEKKIITCTGTAKVTVAGVASPEAPVAFQFEIQDSAKKTLKDGDGNIWKKI